MGEKGEKRYLTTNAISVLDQYRSRYGSSLSDSEIIALLHAKAKDMDDLVRDKTRRLNVG